MSQRTREAGVDQGLCKQEVVRKRRTSSVTFLREPVRLPPVVMSLPPFRTVPDSGPLPSAGVTPRLRYYGPIRHPVGPACPSRGPGRRVHGTNRASRVATPSIFHACRRHYPGGNRPVLSSLSSQPVGGLPLMTGGSASASTVSRPARRSLAFRPAWSLSRPWQPFYQSASVHFVTSMNRPGRYQPEQLLRGIRTHQESAPFHGALSTTLDTMESADDTSTPRGLIIGRIPSDGTRTLCASRSPLQRPADPQ